LGFLNKKKRVFNTEKMIKMKANLLLLAIIFLTKRIEGQFEESTPESTYETPETSKQTTVWNGYCPELNPYCSCKLSPIYIQCNNFDSFDQLDFSLLKNGSTSRRISELELSPNNPLILDSTLNLDGIELYNDVKLRNLKGFEFKSNPFSLFSNLNLYLYNSSLVFYEDSKTQVLIDCSTAASSSIASPVFRSFNFMQLDDISYFKLCPIVFKNVNMRQLTLNRMPENGLLFEDTAGFDDLNSTIETLRIFSSRNLILGNSILNKFVFSNLKTLDLDYTQLKNIEDDTFSHLGKLKTMLVVIENLKEFIKGSNSTWMKSLNSKIEVNLTDLNAVESKKNESFLLTMNNRNNGQSYLYPDEDLTYFENWPHNKMAFYRILSDQNLNCTSTVNFLLKYADNYKTPSTLSTTSTDRCYKPPTTTRAPTTTNFNGYCPELYPYCSCKLSPIYIQCNNFDSFDQLDFSLLKNGSTSRRISELELSPNNPLILDSTLNLDGIELYNDVKLRNLKGFEFKSNPFSLFSNLNLYLYNSSLVFYEDSKTQVLIDCSTAASSSIASPVFRSFNFMQLDDISYFKLCPIVFKNVNMRQLTLNRMPENGLLFEDTAGFDDLNSTIETLRIFSSRNLILGNSILNKFVFSNLKTLDLDYTQLKNIEDDTFSHLGKLKTMLVVIENLKEFIKGSNSTWMKSLNSKIEVNLTDLNAVESKKNESFLLTMNNRNNGQSYLYPDEDLTYFENWPHNKMAFYRILSDQNLNCTSTVNFLLKYADNYKTPSTLSTTSTDRCYKPPTTTRAPTTTNFNGYCPELYPYCSCKLSPIYIQCNNFDSFDQLDFSLLKNGSTSRRISELELSPNNPLILDSTLNLDGIELYNDVKLRNLKGFEFKSNPFSLFSNLNLYLYNSSLVFYEDSKTQVLIDCSTAASSSIASPVFRSFNFMQLDDISYFKLCPIVFKNVNMRQLTLNRMPENGLLFEDTAGFDDLNSTIETLRIFSSRNLILGNSILNKFVFSNLKTLDLDYTQLKNIEDDTFSHLGKLKTMLVVIENLKEFIKGSNSTWMKSLNSKIEVNLTDLNAVESKKNESFLLTMNNRNNGQSYLYPDEDLTYFENWPHNKMAFYRILSDQNLNCTSTVNFLLKYADNYKTPSTLSTTSTDRCYKPPTTTRAPTTVTTGAPGTTGTTGTTVTTTQKLAESVSLTAFLATVIPISVLATLFFTLSIIFYCMFKNIKSKIIPTGDQFQLEENKLKKTSVDF
jgi:hypothetical protein